MHVRTYQPHPLLADAVESYLLIDFGAGPDSMAVNVLPPLNIGLCLHFGGALQTIYQGERKDGPSALTGFHMTPRRYLTEGRSGVALVSLRPGCVGRFADVRADELYDRNVRLADLFPTDAIAQIEHELLLARGDRERIACVEAFLLRLRARRTPDALAAHAAQVLHRHGGALQISALASDLGISLRQFERRFTREIGVSPKKFARLARFHRVLEEAPYARSRADLAAATGYFDQSHLLREFHSLLGVSGADGLPMPLAAGPK